MRVVLLRGLPTLAAVAAVIVLCCILVRADSAAGVTASALLPDLDQAAPSGLVVTAAGPADARRHRLGFRSAVANVGDGPLVIEGHRRTGVNAMVADQLIERRGDTPAVVAGVGRLRYVRSVDHQHWHLLGFDRYELRSLARPDVVVADRKSGFCLGDRYRAAREPLPARPPVPRYTSRCGLTEPGLTSIREGISVGYGDDYAASLEYQDLPLDGLDAGRYLLVHQVNVDRRLRETDYANDASSALIDLSWDAAGLPTVRLLGVCPDTATCQEGPAVPPTPPAAARAAGGRA